MKVEKQVEVMVDVDVDVSLEDITAAIYETPDCVPLVLRGISNCHRFLKAVPNDLIAQLNEKQRKTIFDGLTEQIARFGSTVSATRL